jgi:Cu/Ag efflux protein CusF
MSHAMPSRHLHFHRRLRIPGLLKIAAAAVILLTLAACQKNAPPEPVKEYQLRGEVVSVNPQDQLATLKHEKIEGWMEAMTMEYPVKDKEEFSKLRPGEKIQAKVYVQGTNYWISGITEQPPDSK